MLNSSSDEPISRYSSEKELFDVEDSDREPVVEVCGAEPYRYKPVAAQRETVADADRLAARAHVGQQNRPGNSEGCRCGRCAPHNELVDCKCCHEYP